MILRVAMKQKTQSRWNIHHCSISWYRLHQIDTVTVAQTKTCVLPISTHDIVTEDIAQPSINRRSCPCSFPSCPGPSISSISGKFSTKKKVHLRKWHGVIEDNSRMAQSYQLHKTQEKHVGRSFPLPFPFFPLPSFPLPFGFSKASFRFLAKTAIDRHCSAILKSSPIIRKMTATKKNCAGGGVLLVSSQ